MKTLRNFQDDLAKERMDVDFDNLIDGVKNRSLSLVAFIVFCNDAAERYAQYMCEQQRIICAEHTKTKTTSHYTGGLKGDGMLYEYCEVVDEDSILNAPLATLSHDPKSK